ncbi:hypothetical protein [uncultured Jatrophihabitans sp.]|uniref:hypothetical protein n=1 Tax=uncultured Jatrophihabitans sp. TaxID=1610747 RepID=UPI0035CB7B5B
MGSDLAIGSDDITGLGIGLTVALVVLAVLIVLVVKALVVRVLTVIVVVVLGVLVWQQRQHVRDAYNSHSCDLNATYFGVHLDAPDHVRRACAQRRSGS